MRSPTDTARTAAVAAILLASVAGSAAAQRYAQYFGGSDEYYQPPAFAGNIPYDGHFTFVRVKYRGFEKFAREGPGWSHDYPEGEENLMKILRDVTSVNPFVESGPRIGSVIIALDDPLLFKYPVSYMSEPGGWHPNEKEIAGFRTYIQKGGFMIFDDFREIGWGNDWTNLRQQVAKALPGARWIQLTGKEPIFHCFFDIDLKTAITFPSTSAYGQSPPTYFGVFQDNDPTKRLVLMANVDNDVSESWQWSGAGFVPVTQSNDAFKLGVNYLIYALTH